MSEQNVATVRAIWDAVNRGDLDEAFAYAPDDFVADWSASEAPESGVYRGRETVRRFFEKTLDAWSEIDYFETEIIDVGEQVLRVGGTRARGKGSGAEVTAQGAQVWTFRGGTPVSVRLYQTREEGLEAVGLER
jgi:ketosteroid isomerase-like protein